jgi:AcrR family transcriptional regulator
MRGRVPLRPLTEVADAAVRVFTDKGFRAAGISDVAKALGLSHGALYTYVQSKHALLYLALTRALRPAALDELPVPVADPQPEQLVALAEAWLHTQAGLPLLALAAAGPGTEPAADELGGVIDELYEFIERNQQTITLVERCATELPELGQWYFVQQRRTMIENLGAYLGARIAAGRLREVPDVAVATRFVVETIAWFAMHRNGDPDSAMLDDDACRRTVRHLLLTAFLPG